MRTASGITFWAEAGAGAATSVARARAAAGKMAFMLVSRPVDGVHGAPFMVSQKVYG